MQDKLLQKLANIAIVRQHINNVVHTIDKKSINPIQKIGRELDNQFVELLINNMPSSPQLVANTDKQMDEISLKQREEAKQTEENEPSNIRPKIKTSNKVAKNTNEG